MKNISDKTDLFGQLQRQGNSKIRASSLARTLQVIKFYKDVQS